MYVGPFATAQIQMSRLVRTDDDLKLIRRAFAIVWRAIERFFAAVFNWILDAAPSLTWTFDRIQDFCVFVQAYPHPFHILAWSIFFGPIIILIPCLLVLELSILLMLYSAFMAHGMLPGSIEERFYSLRQQFEETRESLFSTVENWTAVFNNWTSEHPALLVLRLVSAGIGLIILSGIWTDWTFGAVIDSPLLSP